MSPWPIYIDMPWKNILSAAYNSLTGSLPERKQLLNQVESLFGESDGNIACASVRSAFDLFLCTMNFPKGSEIILTAINIPDMCSIVELHGITIVPVDIDMETLAPKEGLLEVAITERTVAVLVAHIYGKWIDMEPVINIAKANGLFVLEDCAECFQGFKQLGHPNSDVALFSFGLIKYYTCFGGAVTVVRNKDLYTKMRAKLESYPIQSHGFFLKKLAKYSLLAFLLNNLTLGRTVPPMLDVVQIDYMEGFISLLRGYPEQLVNQLKYQPSAALLHMMLDRLSNVCQQDFEAAKMKGDFVKDHLPDNVFVPGMKAEVRNYWLFPVIVDDPLEVMKALKQEGVHAYQGATQLRTVYRTKNKLANRETAPCIDGDTDGIGNMRTDSDASSHIKTDPVIGEGFNQSNQMRRPYYKENNMSDHVMAQRCLSSVTPVYSTTQGKDGHKEQSVHGDVKELERCHPDMLYPYNAEYLIDHVLYLPVHRDVPMAYLEKVCNAMDKVMKSRAGVSSKNGQKVVLHSKL